MFQPCTIIKIRIRCISFVIMHFVNDNKSLVVLTPSASVCHSRSHTQSYLQVLSSRAACTVFLRGLRSICLHLNVLRTLVSILRLPSDTFTLGVSCIVPADLLFSYSRSYRRTSRGSFASSFGTKPWKSLSFSWQLVFLLSANQPCQTLCICRHPSAVTT